MEGLNGERDEGRKTRKESVGSGVRSRFLEPFNDIPEENEWRRRAPDGRNGVGFSWRANGESGRTELEDAAVCSRVSFSSLHFPVLVVFLFPFLSLSFFLSFLSLPLSLFSVSTCLSTYIRARDRIILCDRIIPVCAGRSLSDFPRCGWQVRVGLCESSGKIWLAFAFEWNCIFLSLALWYQTRFWRWSTVSPAKWENGGQDWRMKGLISRAENYSLRISIFSSHNRHINASRFWINN